VIRELPRGASVPSRIDNAKYWRDCADEALAIASQMMDADSKSILMGIAQSYAELARLAEARKATKVDPFRK
jgi:hypothetical protein